MGRDESGQSESTGGKVYIDGKERLERRKLTDTHTPSLHLNRKVKGKRKRKNAKGVRRLTAYYCKERTCRPLPAASQAGPSTSLDGRLIRLLQTAARRGPIGIEE